MTNLVKLASELGAMSMRLSYEQDRMTVIAACELLRRLASSDSGVKGGPEPVAWPANLNPRTLDLVQRFALALAKKLRLAEEKYDHTDGWLRDDWESECRDHLYQHLEKGDPRDVAAYCAFMWHHDWITCRPVITAPPADAGMRPTTEDILECISVELSVIAESWTGALSGLADGDTVAEYLTGTVWANLATAIDALTAPGATLSKRQMLECILLSLNVDGVDLNGLTVGELRRAL